MENKLLLEEINKMKGLMNIPLNEVAMGGGGGKLSAFFRSLLDGVEESNASLSRMQLSKLSQTFDDTADFLTTLSSKADFGAIKNTIESFTKVTSKDLDKISEMVKLRDDVLNLLSSKKMSSEVTEGYQKWVDDLDPVMKKQNVKIDGVEQTIEDYLLTQKDLVKRNLESMEEFMFETINKSDAYQFNSADELIDAIKKEYPDGYKLIDDATDGKFFKNVEDSFDSKMSPNLNNTFDNVTSRAIKELVEGSDSALRAWIRKYVGGVADYIFGKEFEIFLKRISSKGKKEEILAKVRKRWTIDPDMTPTQIRNRELAVKYSFNIRWVAYGARQLHWMITKVLWNIATFCIQPVIRWLRGLLGKFADKLTAKYGKSFVDAAGTKITGVLLSEALGLVIAVALSFWFKGISLLVAFGNKTLDWTINLFLPEEYDLNLNFIYDAQQWFVNKFGDPTTIKLIEDIKSLGGFGEDGKASLLSMYQQLLNCQTALGSVTIASNEDLNNASQTIATDEDMDMLGVPLNKSKLDPTIKGLLDFLAGNHSDQEKMEELNKNVDVLQKIKDVLTSKNQTMADLKEQLKLALDECNKTEKPDLPTANDLDVTPSPTTQDTVLVDSLLNGQYKKAKGLIVTSSSDSIK